MPIAKPIELSRSQHAAIDEAIATLSVDSKIGMLFQIDWRVLRTPLPSIPWCANLRSEKPLGPENGAVVEAVTTKGLGSILGGGGARPSPDTPATWRLQTANLQRAASKSESGVPLLYGNDSVHGQANLKGATLFPHHIGQGCMRDADGRPDVALVEELGALAAKESYACGINWIFSPCVAVPHDVRWGRTYEGFSDDPALVATLGAAEVRGLQGVPGVPMAACLKHWVGDGGTALGTGSDDFKWTGAPPAISRHLPPSLSPSLTFSHLAPSDDFKWTGAEPFLLDQGDARIDEVTLRDAHVSTYLPGLACGCLTVMVSYSAVRGEPCHASKRLITGLLKEELGFDGLVVSDFEAVPMLMQPRFVRDAADASASAGAAGAKNASTNKKEPVAKTLADAIALALNAGIDMIMTPAGMFGGASLRAQVAAAKSVVAGPSARVPMSRVDDAVRRILKVKHALGLIALPETAPPPRAPTNLEPAALDACVGCAAHRALSRRAVAQSAVLLLNKEGVLPLSADADGHSGAAQPQVYVVGKGAHHLGMQCGGWSYEWQGVADEKQRFTTGVTILEGLVAQIAPGRAVHLSDDRQAAAWVQSNEARFAGAPSAAGVGTRPPPIALVVAGEKPYAEGGGDVRDLALAHHDAELIEALHRIGARVVLVLLSGRPLLLESQTLTQLHALVAAWLPGTEAGDGLADVLLGRVPFSGELSFGWPKSAAQLGGAVAQGDLLFPRGSGLKTKATSSAPPPVAELM